MYFILGPGVSLCGFGSVAHNRSNDIMSLLSAILMADPAAGNSWQASLEFFLDRNLVQS